MSSTPFKKKQNSIIYFCLGIIFTVFVYQIIVWFYIFMPNVNYKQYDSKLIGLGKQSIVSGDVPVASIITYDGKIIGEGKNDVLRNNNPSGHAEINAIEDCFKKIGYQKFSTLNKDKLILLTTYEPCSMCKGAIEEYNIKHIIFSFPKTVNDKFQSFKNDIKYYNALRQTNNRRLQYDLFKMHPAFDSIAYPF